MAELPPLATPEEFATYLARENATIEGDVDHALNVVSTKIREAARNAISELTSTMTVTRPTDDELLRLPGPVTAVSAVASAAGTVPSYDVDVEGIWTKDGSSWASLGPLTVTFTHGYDPVPADIIDMACSLALEWLKHQKAGGGSTAGLSSVSIDDAREAYTAEAAGQVTPVFIPQITKDELARRFGGAGATAVGGRRR